MDSLGESVSLLELMEVLSLISVGQIFTYIFLRPEETM